jgi:hypothetical protein
MATEKIKLINKFYGGMTRDEKSKISGVASNLEEIDIFANADYFQAEQIFSTDTLPATTEAYAYTSGSDGTAYAYGKETSGSKVRLLSVASGGADNPGAWATIFTSADTTNLAYSVSPVQFFKTTETNSTYLYYCTKTAGTVVLLKRYDITGGTEATVGTLTQLSGSYDRISFRVLFGELYITNGKYMSSVDEDGVFTEAAFTLPLEWTTVDICPVSDVAIILARYSDRTVNFAKGFWWDLTSSVQFDDSFDLSSGGPQWIQNHKETIKICSAINGKARLFQLSGAFAGALPVELPGLVLSNVQADGATQPVSPSKCVAVKDKILYFALNKTDKTGVYAIGQLDSDKPTALVLSKRFSTTSYATHTPTALMIQGSNFYGAFSDNGTASTVRCETNNTPDRSSSGIYESIVIDDDNPISNKDLTDVYINTQPLPASTDVNVSVANDYGSYTEIFRGDGTSLNTTSALQGDFIAKQSKAKKVFKVKTELVSSGANSPKVTAIGLKLYIGREPSPK